MLISCICDYQDKNLLAAERAKGIDLLSLLWHILMTFWLITSGHCFSGTLDPILNKYTNLLWQLFRLLLSNILCYIEKTKKEQKVCMPFTPKTTFFLVIHKDLFFHQKKKWEMLAVMRLFDLTFLNLLQQPEKSFVARFIKSEEMFSQCWSLNRKILLY